MIKLMFGFAGFGFLIIAYVLTLFGKINQESYVFTMMNIIGAALMAAYAYDVDGWAIIMMPLLWGLVSMIYLIKVTIQKRNWI